MHGLQPPLPQTEPAAALRIWLERLALSDFRNYAAAVLQLEPAPVVLAGPNGAGKTNCLEAISLLTAGRGLRSLPFSELSRQGASGGWAVSARLHLGAEQMTVGTGIVPSASGPPSPRAARAVKIDETPAQGSGALAAVRALWLTPAMDGLFMGPANERRRFLDRLALSFNPAYAKQAALFDRAMRQRNKALETFSPSALLSALEAQMAKAAANIAIQRVQVIAALREEIEDERQRAPGSPFPWPRLALEGNLESEAAAAVDAQAIAENYADALARGRERDRLAGRTLIGPHRSDLNVAHGPKDEPARQCSTGEQKALLINLILAQARATKRQAGGLAPLILLDEVAAHLDPARRLALFSSLASLKAQVWMTGTDIEAFLPLKEVTPAQFFLVSNGAFALQNDAESSKKH